MSVEQTPNGRWKVRWREAGKARSRTFDRAADARSHERIIRGQIAAGTHTPAPTSRITVAEMADEWLTHALNLRPASLDTYRRDLDRHLLPTLGATRLQRLTGTDISRLLAEQLASGTAATSVLRHYRTIRRLCAVAITRGHLTVNPCDNVTPPTVEPTEMRFLTAAEVDRLADALPARYRAWCLVAAWGGLRWSELVGLRPTDVQGSTIHVTSELLRRTDGTWYRLSPKTKAGRRQVTLPARAAGPLAAHLDTHPGDLVFTNTRGNPLVPSSFTSNIWAKALPKAKIEGRLRIHDLRHTAVALAIAAGAHPKAIQVRMGHASIAVTMDLYGHLFPQADADLAASLDQLN